MAVRCAEYMKDGSHSIFAFLRDEKSFGMDERSISGRNEGENVDIPSGFPTPDAFFSSEKADILPEMNPSGFPIFPENCPRRAGSIAARTGVAQNIPTKIRIAPILAIVASFMGNSNCT